MTVVVFVFYASLWYINLILNTIIAIVLFGPTFTLLAVFNSYGQKQPTSATISQLHNNLLGYKSNTIMWVAWVLSTILRIHLVYCPVPPSAALSLTLSYNWVVPSCHLELDNICPLWCRCLPMLSNLTPLSACVIHLTAFGNITVGQLKKWSYSSSDSHTSMKTKDLHPIQVQRRKLPPNIIQ